MRYNFCVRQMLPFFMVIFSTTGAALSADIKMLGKGAPFQFSDLPPQSALSQSLQTLPPAQMQRAMTWLHSFSFPESDLASLRVDAEGGVLYKESNKPKPRRPTPSALASASPSINSLVNADVFKLHSRPGAANKAYLDFDGHEINGTAWNRENNISTYHAAGFDLDGNPRNFSSDERNKIAEIWHRISEDYAPFDIDITTEQPSQYGPTIGHVLFTRDSDASGVDMPFKGSGGVSYVNVWGKDDYASSYSPALVYYNALDNGYPPYMAEAGAHELGHNLGLSHDGTLDSSQNMNCITSNEYYCGLGSGSVSWAPIMGSSYYSNVTQWSKGEYPNANNNQDDISIIKEKLHPRVDTVKNTINGATQLSVQADGNILVTNPENDPTNTDPFNKGIIETNEDVDVFWFESGAGTVNLTVNPAWDAYFRGDMRGANLDIKISLYNASGLLIASDDPTDETYAAITTSLSAGRYYLAVTGVRNTITPYSGYGSVGEYFISGFIIPPVVTTDNAPPSPNPMSWSTPPNALSGNTITMSATPATDASGQVQYSFRCLSGGQGCIDSGWQTSPNYEISGLAQGTYYDFSVKARDRFGNETTESVVAGAITASNQLPQMVEDTTYINVQAITFISEPYVVQVKVDTSISIPVLTNDRDQDGDALSITAVGQAKYGTATFEANTITYTPYTRGSYIFNSFESLKEYFAGDTFTYTVSDGHGGTAIGKVTVIPMSKNTY